MKRISTLLSKLSIIATFLSFAFSASAEEYKSMIRYDRVWECYCDGYGPGRTIKCMKFVGTEVINGKEYHKIETFRKTFPEINYDTNTWNHDKYVDGLHEHEGYLREENGVAYTLIVCGQDDLPAYDGRIDSMYGPLFIPGKSEPKENEVLSEVPIYDFTYKFGQTYEGISFCTGLSHSCPFTVIRDENIDINGEMYRRFGLCTSKVMEHECHGEEVVEGIGATEYGCLNYHELAARPAMIWANNYFTRLLDIYGNVIYNPRPDSMFDIPYESFELLNGVDLIEDVVSTAHCYDMMGRRITAPAPGQLYIQGGKKHIAR